MSETINIPMAEKITTIRVTERTKSILESFSRNKETHEETLLRLMRIAESYSQEESTQVIRDGNVEGVNYSRLHKTINISTSKGDYDIVFTYNDISMLSPKNTEPLKKFMANHRGNFEWEFSIDIVNISKGKKWADPKKFKDKNEYLLIYFACLKNIIEDTFSVKLYEITTEEDYTSQSKWEEAYKRCSLSRESLERDVKKILKNA